MLSEIFETHEAGLDWLAPILFRRAAIAYEHAGLTREAADCWVAAHDTGHAGEVYLREGDYKRAAPLLLAAGHYEEALRMYDMWEQVLQRSRQDQRAFMIQYPSLLLGKAACLFLSGSDKEEARKQYRAARKLIDEIDTVSESQQPAFVKHSFISAKLWEALADYGVIVGRSDLIDLGYERALAQYGESYNNERVRALRAYIEAVAENRSLVAELETRLAEWDKNYFTKRAERQPVLTWQGRSFWQYTRVRLNAWAGTFKPEQTGRHTEVHASPGCMGFVVGSSSDQALRIRWDGQEFFRAQPDDSGTVTAEDFFSIQTDVKRRVWLDSFESVVHAGLLDIIEMHEDKS